MPARTTVGFYKKDGSLVAFKAKPKRSPARTYKELNKRLKKLKSPVMRARATKKWEKARGL
jgi:hypothetical protein